MALQRMDSKVREIQQWVTSHIASNGQIHGLRKESEMELEEQVVCGSRLQGGTPGVEDGPFLMLYHQLLSSAGTPFLTPDTH